MSDEIHQLVYGKRMREERHIQRVQQRLFIIGRWRRQSDVAMLAVPIGMVTDVLEERVERAAEPVVAFHNGDQRM